MGGLGEYGPHGREVVRMLPPDATYLFQGLKILGDPNVPAGQVSFRVPHQEPVPDGDNLVCVWQPRTCTGAGGLARG
jgi:hypothetical protein